jgi:hypothetical protein
VRQVEESTPKARGRTALPGTERLTILPVEAQDQPPNNILVYSEGRVHEEMQAGPETRLAAPPVQLDYWVD